VLQKGVAELTGRKLFTVPVTEIAVASGQPAAVA
jgi:hypothetical protein